MRRRRRGGNFDDTFTGRMSRLIEPAVLYLLGCGEATHGYELLEEVNKLGLTETQVDPGAIYRVLRQLEADGAVSSAWDTTGGGPARRNYELTELGVARLASWVDLISRLADSMQQFVSGAQQLLDDSE